MDYKFVVENLSTVIWHSAILVSVVGVLKIFLTQYFLYKITVAKKSEIRFSKNGKTASYSNYEDNAEKVINIYRNVDADDDDVFKAS
ncbi:MAG: hypothetical protein H6625_03995 [Bdellovibrionaceae bacterium]|nr:hypothetical protein [Pseudobdellovibrionaceae bacterium]